MSTKPVCTNFPVPAFKYGDTVSLIPCDNVHCRVVDIHYFAHGLEYSVRYFMNGEAKTVRVFEDELFGVVL